MVSIFLHWILLHRLLLIVCRVEVSITDCLRVSAQDLEKASPNLVQKLLNDQLWMPLLTHVRLRGVFHVVYSTAHFIIH